MEKPIFKGEPVIELRAGVLVYDAFGREIAKRVNSQYKYTLAELTSNPGKDQPFRESNIFKLFAIDKSARDLGARVMLPEEAQLLLNLDKMPERNTSYKDLGLVMDFSGKNHQIALNLYNQLNQGDKDLDKFPAIFVGLEPAKLDIQNYNLAFKLTPYSQIRTAKILASATGDFNNGDSELIRSGVPSRLERGNRKLYTLQQKEQSIENLGVSGLCLGWSLGLDSGSEDLAYSGEYSRVVVVSGEDASQNFLGESLANIQRTRDAQIAQIEHV